MSEQIDSEQGSEGGRARSDRKQREGVVVSDVQDKTIVVTAEQQRVHPLYNKRISKSRKFHVHDEDNEAHVGDTVRIVETRPLSKTKRWRLAQIIERAR